MVGKSLVIGLVLVLFTSSGLCGTLVTLEEAEELISDNENLVIIDCRPCKKCYDKKHIPNAVWMYFPYSLYNTTHDYLVYGNSRSDEFTEMLSNNITSNVYNLKDYRTLLRNGSENLDEDGKQFPIFVLIISITILVILYLYGRRKNRE